jgi:hypothetical protein
MPALQRLAAEGRLRLSTGRKVLLSKAEVAKDVVEFKGHPLVSSMHPTTIEVTTEEHLTEKGDCIIGVGASKGCLQLSEEVKEGLRCKDSRVTISIIVGRHLFRVNAGGDPRLRLTHPHDMVIRRSDFISDRTLAVHADAAARNIPREIVRLLRDSATTGRMEIEITGP